eukprot:Rhum_TRINITY_DN14027_c4_g1::Rhum_TRINITY_DN14027_c4_g1_i1::g.67975::m.67975
MRRKGRAQRDRTPRRQRHAPGPFAPLRQRQLAGKPRLSLQRNSQTRVQSDAAAPAAAAVVAVRRRHPPPLPPQDTHETLRDGERRAVLQLPRHEPVVRQGGAGQRRNRVAVGAHLGEPRNARQRPPETLRVALRRVVGEGCVACHRVRTAAQALLRQRHRLPLQRPVEALRHRQPRAVPQLLGHAGVALAGGVAAQQRRPHAGSEVRRRRAGVVVHSLLHLCCDLRGVLQLLRLLGRRVLRRPQLKLQAVAGGAGGRRCGGGGGAAAPLSRHRSRLARGLQLCLHGLQLVCPRLQLCLQHTGALVGHAAAAAWVEGSNARQLRLHRRSGGQLSEPVHGGRAVSVGHNQVGEQQVLAQHALLHAVLQQYADALAALRQHPAFGRGVHGAVAGHLAGPGVAPLQRPQARNRHVRDADLLRVHVLQLRTQHLLQPRRLCKPCVRVDHVLRQRRELLRHLTVLPRQHRRLRTRLRLRTPRLLHSRSCPLRRCLLLLGLRRRVCGGGGSVGLCREVGDGPACLLQLCVARAEGRVERRCAVAHLRGFCGGGHSRVALCRVGSLGGLEALLQLCHLTLGRRDIAVVLGGLSFQAPSQRFFLGRPVRCLLFRRERLCELCSHCADALLVVARLLQRRAVLLLQALDFLAKLGCFFEPGLCNGVVAALPSYIRRKVDVLPRQLSRPVLHLRKLLLSCPLRRLRLPNGRSQALRLRRQLHGLLVQRLHLLLLLLPRLLLLIVRRPVARPLNLQVGNRVLQQPDLLAQPCVLLAQRAQLLQLRLRPACPLLAAPHRLVHKQPHPRHLILRTLHLCLQRLALPPRRRNPLLTCPRRRRRLLRRPRPQLRLPHACR